MKPLLCLALVAACGAPDYDVEPYSPAQHGWPYLSPEQIDGREPYSRPISGDQLAQQLEAVFAAEPPAPRADAPVDLRPRIVRALNIGFMLDGLQERPREVRVIAAAHRGDFVWYRVTVSDDIVQDLELDYLEPIGRTGPAPGVVGLHGHYDDGQVFAEDYLGVELARRGYAVVAPTFRHMACGDDERDQAVYLLREGFSLMTYRVYEALVALEFLRTRAGVDPTRIGIAAHSGGSSTANLVVRLSDAVAAVMTDWQVEYREGCTGRVHCETVPALFPHAAEINDQGSLKMPHLRVEYGFGDDEVRAGILAFFDQTLGAS
ncbi:MAG TPA: hypothetical protein VML75_22220 [Kofleriaceae bacterium]|nr:hypothetical protein [Kofleriaceae bacterium]